MNSAGIISLGNQVIQVGSPLAGQRARIRLDGQVMHVITQDGVLWRSLPCPISPGQRHKLQGVRFTGPEPLPPAALTIQRKVSSRGGVQVARQRIQVGFPHTGQTVTIQFGDSILRIIDQHGELITTTVPRLSDGEISRFKATAAGSHVTSSDTFARQRDGQTSGQGDLSCWHRTEPG